MSISRIGAAGGVSRDQASAGHDAVDRADSQSQAPASRNEKVDQVAKLYEKQFLREMFKAMRQTVTPTNEPSMAENIYRNQLDDQYIEAWGDQGGIGLSNIIYDQIMERFFGQPQAQAMRKQGPVALTDRDVIRVAQVKQQSGSGGPSGTQVPLQIEVKPSQTGESAKIQAPWDAKIVQSTKLEGGKQAVTLEHGQGLRSTLIFDGVPSAETKVGDSIPKGQTIGTLAPEAKSFLWNLNQPAGREPAARAPAQPSSPAP